jgi:hypothetical protein
MRRSLKTRRPQMIPRRVLLFCIGCICSAAIPAYGQASQTIFLPPVNLAATETAGIGIMSAAAGYVGSAFPTTCTASVTFYGADGSALGAATNFTIGDTRQIFAAELPYASTGANGSSISVSAQIALTPKGGTFSVLAPPIPLCAIVFSLETFDTASGVTHAFVSGWAAQGTTTVTSIGAVSVSPCVYSSLCGDIPEQQSPRNIVLPPMGFGGTETAQVSVVNTAPGSSGVAASCQGSVSFYDPSGSIVGTSSSFTVGTGQIFSAKLPHASTGAAGLSTLIRAEIGLSTAPSTGSILGSAPSVPATHPCELVFSLETYDSATGITHAVVSGTTAQGAPIGVPKGGRWR